MTGVTCEAGNSHSFKAPDFTHVVPFYLLILPMYGQVFYWSTILILVALVWTDFTVDDYILI